MLLKDEDFHPHLRARMQQRGVTREKVERTLSEVAGLIVLTVKARYGQGFPRAR